eukprot:4765135-Prymnesium_polylepis.1
MRKVGAASDGTAAHLVLLAARPWSLATHALFPAEARARAITLLLLGHRLAREPRYEGVAGAMVDVWLAYVMPLAVLRHFEGWESEPQRLRNLCIGEDYTGSAVSTHVVATWSRLEAVKLSKRCLQWRQGELKSRQNDDVHRPSQAAGVLLTRIPCTLGSGRAASEGGPASDVFTLRLMHASHTPQNAPKQASRPHMSGRLQPVG